jgi:hypothetical protein
MTADEALEAPEIGPGGNAAEGVLLCPACGSEYLHHSVVTVFDRGEDEVETIVTESTPDSLVRTVLPSRECANPSDRRDGVAVRLWCEICPGPDFELCIAQHKGQTLLTWRRAAEIPKGGAA